LIFGGGGVVRVSVVRTSGARDRSFGISDQQPVQIDG